SASAFLPATIKHLSTYHNFSIFTYTNRLSLLLMESSWIWQNYQNYSRPCRQGNLRCLFLATLAAVRLNWRCLSFTFIIRFVWTNRSNRLSLCLLLPLIEG